MQGTGAEKPVSVTAGWFSGRREVTGICGGGSVTSRGKPGGLWSSERISLVGVKVTCSQFKARTLVWGQIPCPSPSWDAPMLI